MSRCVRACWRGRGRGAGQSNVEPVMKDPWSVRTKDREGRRDGTREEEYCGVLKAPCLDAPASPGGVECGRRDVSACGGAL